MSTKQNANIDFNSETNEYKVTFTSNNTILLYEAWSEDKYASVRMSIEKLLNEFVCDVHEYNSKNIVKYTPTTVIHFSDSIHTLILTNMIINSCGNTVFYFKKNSIIFIDGSKPINSELPCGTFINIRFDIDSFYKSKYLSCNKKHNSL